MPPINELIQQRKSKKVERVLFEDDDEFRTSRIIHGRWEEYSSSLPPDVFLSLDSAITTQGRRIHKSPRCRFSVDGFQDQLGKTHPNHKHFYSLYHLFIKEFNMLLTEQPTDIANFCFIAYRALQNRNGDYELLKVISQPYSYISGGRIEDFISWYIPIKRFSGEPFRSEMLALKNENDPSFRKIEQLFVDRKKELIDYLQFTSRQKEVVQHLGQALLKNEIANNMHVSIRTVEKYNQQILSKGQDLFPLNNFSTAVDVVNYLKLMNII